MTHQFPSVKTIAWLTSAQMVEVDRAMIEDFHIELMQMMENAGRALARVARERFLGGDPGGKQVIVLAGPGGNGGGALTCAPPRGLGRACVGLSRGTGERFHASAGAPA